MDLVDRTQNTLDATSQNYKYIVYIQKQNSGIKPDSKLKTRMDYLVSQMKNWCS